MMRELLRRSWRKLAALAAAGVLAGAAADIAYGQSPEPGNLLERLERLEKQNRELQQKLNSISSPVATESPSAIDAKAVENIVSEYLKAQAKKEEAKKNEPVAVGSDLNFKASWKNGLNLATTNKDFQVHVGGRMHFDMGTFDPDPEANMPVFHDAAGFRRARLRVDGQMWEIFKWTTEVDFANAGATGSTAAFTDFYGDIGQLPFVGGIRIGRFKEPFSLEELTSSRYITTIERSAPHQAFVPARSLGIMLHRTFGDEQRASAYTGIFRDDTSDGIDPSRGNGGFGQGDGEYSWTSRVTFRPVWAHNGRCLVHIGGAYSYRNYSDDAIPPRNRPRHAAAGEVRIGTPALLDTGGIDLIASSHLFGGEFAAQYGPVYVQSDVYFAQDNRENGFGVSQPSPNWWGGYVQVGYFLTGEHRGYSRSSGAFDRVIPHENFFLVRDGDGAVSRGKGAWELVFRISYVDLNDEDFVEAVNAARAGGTGLYRGYTFGVNWYLNPNMKWMVNYVHANRSSTSGDAFRGQVDSLFARFAMDF